MQHAIDACKIPEQEMKRLSHCANTGMVLPLGYGPLMRFGHQQTIAFHRKRCMGLAVRKVARGASFIFLPQTDAISSERATPK